MVELESKIREEVETLERLRDELKLKASLGKAELRDVWDEAERKWLALTDHVRGIKQATTDSAKNVSQAAQILIDELKESYNRIKTAT